MKSISIDENNWSPVKLKYAYDERVNLQNSIFETKDGISFCTNPASKDGKDVKINNYSELMLTKPLMGEELVSFDLETDEYPKQFTTYLLLNAYPNIQPDSSYIMIIPETSDSITRDFITRRGVNDAGDVINSEYFASESDNNNIYYNVTLHNSNELSISHDDNYTTTFLTVTGSPTNNTLTFLFSAAELDIPSENQKFNYISQNEDGYILLSKKFNNKAHYITVLSTGMALTATTVVDQQQTYPFLGVIRIVPQEKTSSSLKMENNWVSYRTYGNQNNLNINDAKSYNKLQNNYLISTQYTQITGDEMLVDVIPLKNQLTASNKTLRGNPFVNFAQCDHRTYDKIHSGTNQRTGNINISTGYNSYQTEIILEPDTVTYFHTPQDMYPYEKININDSGLIQNGAIGGDTPIVSDKLFKRAADYKYFSPNGAPSDEETGVWLCTWLKSNIGVAWDPEVEYNVDIIVNYKGKVFEALQKNKGVTPGRDNRIWLESDISNEPVWVDRYYNPRAFSAQEALRIENQYSTYVSKFEYIIDTLSAENIYVFDKKSDLTFEPGCAYAYYRVGTDENQTTIDNIPNKIHDGVSPAYEHDRTQYLPVDNRLTFDGTRYIETTTPANIQDASFTISFELDTLDWKTPIGSQLVGNYINKGVAFYNKRNTTPYVIIPEQDSIEIYNTDTEPLFSIPVSSAFVARGCNSDNIHIIQDRWVGVQWSSTAIYNLGDIVYNNGGVYQSLSAHAHSYKDRPPDSTLAPPGSESLPGKGNFQWEELNYHKYRLLQYDMKGMLVETTILRNIPPEETILDFKVDDQCIYVLTDTNKIRKYSVDTEAIDTLNAVAPTHVVGGTRHDINIPNFVFPESQSTFVHELSGNQYRINCDCYTFDMTGSLWFTKDNVTYKYTASTRRGSNAVYNNLINGANVSLIAEEFIEGSRGNTIRLDGDGVSSVTRLVNNWNNSHPDNKIQIIDKIGSTVIPDKDYIIQFSGGVDIGQPVTFASISSNTVLDLKCDYDNNILLLTDDYKIHKYTNSRVKIFDMNVTDSIELDNTITAMRMNLVSEFRSGTYMNYMLILVSDNLHNLYSLKIDLDGNVIQQLKLISNKPGLDIRSQQCFNITNHEVSKTINLETINTNYIIFLMRYESYFDTDKTYVVSMKYDVSDLTPGKHHFCVGFNANNSNISLFVDGVIQQTIKSDDIFTGAAYKFSKTIHSPLHVGTDSFFNNITLADQVNIPDYNFCTRSTISKLRVFNDYLNFYKIKSLTREGKNILPVELVLPTGRRSYIDKITKYYRHRTPGRRSDVVDVEVIPERGYIDDVVADKLTEELRDIVKGNLPVNKSLREVRWVNE